MNYRYYIKNFIRNYFIIFAVVVISVTILRQIFAPTEYFELKDIFIYMICSLVGELPSLIFYSSKEIPEKQMRIRIIIHFTVLEAGLLIFAHALGVVNDILGTTLLAFQIAIIYLLVRFLLWSDDKKEANIINEKLKLLKAEVENDLDE